MTLRLLLFISTLFLSCATINYTNCIDNARLQAQAFNRMTGHKTGIAYGYTNSGKYHAQAYAVKPDGERIWLTQYPRKVEILIGEQDQWFEPKTFKDLYRE